MRLEKVGEIVCGLNALAKHIGLVIPVTYVMYIDVGYRNIVVKLRSRPIEICRDFTKTFTKDKILRFPPIYRQMLEELYTKCLEFRRIAKAKKMGVKLEKDAIAGIIYDIVYGFIDNSIFIANSFLMTKLGVSPVSGNMVYRYRSEVIVPRFGKKYDSLRVALYRCKEKT